MRKATLEPEHKIIDALIKQEQEHLEKLNELIRKL